MFLNKIIFMDRLRNNKGCYIRPVMQKTKYGNYELIGRIYFDYDDQDNKVYTAKDWEGNQIFQDEKKLSIIKRRFMQQGYKMVLQKESRINELKVIREQKEAKEIER